MLRHSNRKLKESLSIDFTSMDHRKKPIGSPQCGSLVYWSSSFLWQPARILIVEALPPWWSETGTVLCDALDNFLSLACSLDGPCRIPLLSLYVISKQQECLLPFVQVRGNLARLRSCVDELRSIPGEGCIKQPARAAELLRRAVLDSVQQFKQYTRHQPSNNTSVEVTVMSGQPGRTIMRLLEVGLKDSDLLSLRRLLVVQIGTAADGGHDTPSPEQTTNEAADSQMLGVEVELQQVENSVTAIEMVLKAWLHEQGGDREHLHLQLPSAVGNPNPVCLKCDLQERLISPTLLPLTPNLGVNTESIQEFLPLAKGSAHHSPLPRTLKAIKALHADGVCESVLYGLPLVIRPTTCWQLDWDEMETNHNLFHALCHTLRSRDLLLLLLLEPDQRSTGEGEGVISHYILQPSTSLSLLLKPVVSKELLLPCSLPVSPQDPTPNAARTLQACLSQLEEDFVFNPLSLSSNLCQHLRSRGRLLAQPPYPYRTAPSVAHRDQTRPLEGAKPSPSGAPRQPHNQGRQLGTHNKVRATVAPLPSSSAHYSSSSSAPGSAKASRPALTLLSSSSRSRGPRPAPPLCSPLDGDKEKN
ncbi:meiosis 1 arrest protein [Genypterus blacodes]|uniref:meiosis 1 arrest protein n=1 Tax=Genypterus blacodes TaxID=154954 RepID=UPI003F75AAA6